MNNNEIKLPRCPECGGAVKLTAKPGRTREVKQGVVLSIPDGFKTPICSRCGEEFMIPEVSEELDCIIGSFNDTKTRLEKVEEQLAIKLKVSPQSVRELLLNSNYIHDELIDEWHSEYATYCEYINALEADLINEKTEREVFVLNEMCKKLGAAEEFIQQYNQKEDKNNE